MSFVILQRDTANFGTPDSIYYSAHVGFTGGKTKETPLMEISYCGKVTGADRILGSIAANLTSMLNGRKPIIDIKAVIEDSGAGHSGDFFLTLRRTYPTESTQEQFTVLVQIDRGVPPPIRQLLVDKIKSEGGFGAIVKGFKLNSLPPASPQIPTLL